MPQLTSNRNEALFGAMLKLAVATLRAGKEPTLLFNALDRVPDFHLQCTLGLVKRQCPGYLEL